MGEARRQYCCTAGGMLNVLPNVEMATLANATSWCFEQTSPMRGKVTEVIRRCRVAWPKAA